MLLFHNVLIVDSLSTQPTSEAEFWTWPGVLAICAVLVFLGWFIDWLLRKKHKETILKKLSEFEQRLARLPVRRWQVAIASKVISFWSSLNWAAGLLFRSEDWKSGPRASAFATLFAVIIVLSFIYIIEGFRIGVGLLSISGLIPLTLAACFLLASTILANAFGFPESRSLHRLSVFLACTITPPFVVSTWFSLTTVFFRIFLQYSGPSTYWVTHLAQSISDVPINATFVLILFNFPFDFATILVSIKLLQFVKEKGRYIICIAMLDIIISAALVILLHTTLKTIEPGGFSHLKLNFALSVDWFIQVVTFEASSTHPDWPLTPTLFTTFIPVTLYMSAFLFLGIIIKPFARTASYICGLLFEKKQTPFLAFSLILSGLLAVAKALSEWEWFLHLFKRLLS